MTSTTGSPTTGSCVFVGLNVVSWLSRKQATVSCSSAEAEYRAIANVTGELRWFCGLLRELVICIPHSPIIYSDTTIYMSANPAIQGKSRQIHINYTTNRRYNHEISLM